MPSDPCYVADAVSLTSVPASGSKPPRFASQSRPQVPSGAPHPDRIFFGSTHSDCEHRTLLATIANALSSFESRRAPEIALPVAQPSQMSPSPLAPSARPRRASRPLLAGSPAASSAHRLCPGLSRGHPSHFPPPSSASLPAPSVRSIPRLAPQHFHLRSQTRLPLARVAHRSLAAVPPDGILFRRPSRGILVSRSCRRELCEPFELCY